VAATEFNSVCDERAKTNIVDFEDGLCLNLVKQLQPKHFKMKSDGTIKVGYVAQQVRSVLPNAITLVDRDGISGFHMLDASQINACHTGAIRELLKRIEALEAKIQNLLGA
jgi:hypothetical protein